MATSGSYNFLVTAAEVYTAALEDLHVISPGGTVTSAQSTMCLSRLNMIAKQWQGTADMSAGLKIFSRKRVHLFLVKAQNQYLIGPASTDGNATTQYGRTTLSASAAAAATSLSITSNNDATTFPGSTSTMADSDYIGIQLDDGTLQWTTITGTPSTTANINTALSSAASSGNYVWWYTSKAQRLVHVESAVLRDSNYDDMPLSVFRTARDYEQGIPSKYADGTPVAILIEPLILNTRITCDSQPTNVTDTIVLTGLYPSEDYDSTSNDIAFPQEWYLPLKWELMFQLPSFGRRWTPEMKEARSQALAIAKQLNAEVCTDYFQSAT